MALRKTKEKKVSFGRMVSSVLMALCLIFLTSINFFIYSTAKPESKVNVFGMNTEETETDFPPSGPTEEKAAGSGYSAAEEIIHEHHALIDFYASNHRYLHHIAEAEKVEMFHPELILPPPKF